MAYVHKFSKGEYQKVAEFETEEKAVEFCEEHHWKIAGCDLEIFDVSYVPSAKRIADCEDYVMQSESIYDVNW